jgi:hypothetical protein
MNLNELAKAIAEIEGKKIELSVAQIKEVLLCLGKVLAKQRTVVQADLVKKIIDRGARRLGLVKDNDYIAAMHFFPLYKKRT